MKANAIVRIIIWSIVIIVLLGILCTILFGGSLLLRNSKRSHPTEETYAPVRVDESSTADTQLETPMEVMEPGESIGIGADNIRNLDIEWVAGSIVIQSADVETIEISESDVSDAKYAMLWKVSGQKLTILFCEESIMDFNFGITIHDSISKDLTILVPRDWECDTLEIDAASASVEVNDLTIREVEFDGASGVCKFGNCTVDKVDLDTASGDITFIGSLNILDCDAASASVYAVLDNVPTRMDMDSLSGDLDITLPADAGFTVSMDGLSTNFSSDFETTLQNKNYVSGDGSCRINVDGVSGDVIIRKAAQTAPSDSAGSHHHTDTCTTDPSSCPDYTGEHHHTDSCTTAPASCPDYTGEHHHTDSCTTDPSSCPDYTGERHHTEN